MSSSSSSRRRIATSPPGRDDDVGCCRAAAPDVVEVEVVSRHPSQSPRTTSQTVPSPPTTTMQSKSGSGAPPPEPGLVCGLAAPAGLLDPLGFILGGVLRLSAWKRAAAKARLRSVASRLREVTRTSKATSAASRTGLTSRWKTRFAFPTPPFGFTTTSARRGVAGYAARNVALTSSATSAGASTAIRSRRNARSPPERHPTDVAGHE
mmetsp:Transcript_892/g.3023  ORF Transcript_892/g.3023 Transcript_892/m.3023 type:complete len:208 (+) Transcript_892:393-1016(+)